VAFGLPTNEVEPVVVGGMYKPRNYPSRMRYKLLHYNATTGYCRVAHYYLHTYVRDSDTTIGTLTNRFTFVSPGSADP
jgi:hypothetical protein